MFEFTLFVDGKTSRIRFQCRYCTNYLEFIQQQFAVWKSVYHWSRCVYFHVYDHDLKVNTEGPAKIFTCYNIFLLFYRYVWITFKFCRCSVYTYIKLRNASNIPHVIIRSFVEHILKLCLQLPIFFYIWVFNTKATTYKRKESC